MSKKINVTLKTLDKQFEEICEIEESEIPKAGEIFQLNIEDEIEIFLIKFILSNNDNDDLSIFGSFIEKF